MNEASLALEAAVIALGFYVLFALFAGTAAQVSGRSVRSWPVGRLRLVKDQYQGRSKRMIVLACNIFLAGVSQVFVLWILVVTPFGFIGRVLLLLEVGASMLWTVHLVRLPTDAGTRRM